MGGLTQAGGIGWMVRKYGLTIDSLLAAEVVTAAGDVVRASATENPDLFWALRGGAGNFGVVTAFEFQAEPVSTVHFGTIAFALDDVPQLLKSWAAAMRGAPDELSTTLVLMPGFGDFPAGALLCVCLAADDTSALEPLRAIGTVVAEDISERPYAEILEEARPPEGVLPVIGNTLVESVDEPLIDAIATAYARGRTRGVPAQPRWRLRPGGPRGDGFRPSRCRGARRVRGLPPAGRDGGPDRRSPRGVAHDRRPRRRVVRRVPRLRHRRGRRRALAGRDPGAAASGQANLGSRERLPPELQRRSLADRTRMGHEGGFRRRQALR